MDYDYGLECTLKPLLLTPTERHSPRSVGTFLHEWFVEFTSGSGVNRRPAMLTVVLQHTPNTLISFILTHTFKFLILSFQLHCAHRYQLLRLILETTCQSMISVHRPVAIISLNSLTFPDYFCFSLTLEIFKDPDFS